MDFGLTYVMDRPLPDFSFVILVLCMQKRQLIINKELDMQNKTSAKLPPRNRHKIKLECCCRGVVAQYSQYVSPWTVTPKLTVRKGGN